MLTAEDVRALDLNSAFRGVPTTHLMENAGAAVASAAVKLFAPKRVLVLAGPGNNGGDGLVAAQELAATASVTVLLSSDPDRLKTPEARNALENLDRRRVRVETFRSPWRFREVAKSSDLVIDALLGMGAFGDLHDPIRSMARLANQSRRPILSLDVPTGLGGRLQIRPTATVTLHARKRGMTKSNSGRILVRPIGIPPQAETHAGPGDLATYYPRNRPDSHKGENGRLLVVAGGPYCGAPLLSAAAALRTGADIVRLYTPEECAEAAEASQPDLIVHAGVEDRTLALDDLPHIVALLARVDAVLLGPGLGLGGPAKKLARAAIQAVTRARVPLVLDADALAVAGEAPRALRRRGVLATPHHREFRDLTGRPLPNEEARRGAAAAQQARRLGLTLLLKGPTDVITDGRRTKLNDTHHPWMTVGGTGDVLGGIAAALVAKHVEPFRAATAAAFLNGAAGLRAFEAKSWGARASDLLVEIPNVLRDWLP